MMTSEQYRDSLDDLNLDVYIQNNRVDNVHDNPVIRRAIDATAKTYEMAHRPDYAHVMTAISHINGSRINRFNHVNQNIDDLIKKMTLDRLFNGNNGSCFHRTLGMNTLNTLSITTEDMDAEYGTDYHGRFLQYLEYIQANDLTCDGSMVDPRANRYLPPHRHPNPDTLLHVVDERDAGLMLYGVKACRMSALTAHEIIVIPTTAVTELDDLYAVLFSLPSDAEGVTFIIERDLHTAAMSGDTIASRERERFKDQEILCVFDNVMVPWERVFMYKEGVKTGVDSLFLDLRINHPIALSC